MIPYGLLNVFIKPLVYRRTSQSHLLCVLNRQQSYISYCSVLKVHLSQPEKWCCYSRCCSTNYQNIHLCFFTYLTTIDSPLVKTVTPSQRKHGSVSHLEQEEVTTSTVLVTAAKSWNSVHVTEVPPGDIKSAKKRGCPSAFLSANQSHCECCSELYTGSRDSLVAVLNLYAEEDTLSPHPLFKKCTQPRVTIGSVSMVSCTHTHSCPPRHMCT